MTLQPVIKWTGSKRHQADQIVSQFPKQIEIYHEPFVGGGSVMFRLLHSDIKVGKVVCSDICSPLIGLWNIIKSNHTELLKKYQDHHEKLKVDGRDYYFKIRESFNKDKDPTAFFFLLRTCRNGLVRFNGKGGFNSCFHDTRNGIEPERLQPILEDWHYKLAQVEFKVGDFSEVVGTETDFIYADPPYVSGESFYDKKFDFTLFWNWLRSQKCDYAFSFNGVNQAAHQIPSDVFTKKTHTAKAVSAFRKLEYSRQQRVDNIYHVEESLYLKER